MAVDHYEPTAVMDANGRLGTVLFWVRGNDGLTYWQRRARARKWARGLGSIPSRATSERALKALQKRSP